MAAQTGGDPTYDDSDVAANRPLQVGEIDELILDGGRLFQRDRQRVVHLLRRVSATMREQQSRFTELADGIDRVRSQQAFDGDPMTRAINALGELSPDEQRQLMDVNYLAAMEQLRVDRQGLERLQLLAVNDVNRVRLLVGTLTADPTLDAEVRARLEQLLTQLSSLRATGQ